VTEVSWELGNEVLGTGETLDATFDEAGVHMVSLVAVDDRDARGTATAEVHVCGREAVPCTSDDDCCGVLECWPDPGGIWTCGPPPVCGDGVVEGEEAFDDCVIDADCCDGWQCDLDRQRCERV
jgi:hypothetical protein